MLTNDSIIAIRACCRDAGLPIKSIFRAAHLSDSLFHKWQKDPSIATSSSLKKLDEGLGKMIDLLVALRAKLRTATEQRP